MSPVRALVDRNPVGYLTLSMHVFMIIYSVSYDIVKRNLDENNKIIGLVSIKIKVAAYMTGLNKIILWLYAVF